MSFLGSWYARGEQERGDEADARLDQLNREKLARGGIDQAEYDRRARAISASYIDVDKEIDAAFVEGAKEGYQSTTGGLKAFIAAPFKFLFEILPWQLWLAAAVALFFWMGGFAWLKGRLK